MKDWKDAPSTEKKKKQIQSVSVTTFLQKTILVSLINVRAKGRWRRRNCFFSWSKLQKVITMFIHFGSSSAAALLLEKGTISQFQGLIRMPKCLRSLIFYPNDNPLSGGQWVPVPFQHFEWMDGGAYNNSLLQFTHHRAVGVTAQESGFRESTSQWISRDDPEPKITHPGSVGVSNLVDCESRSEFEARKM